jgi:hypothetical protein
MDEIAMRKSAILFSKSFQEFQIQVFDGVCFDIRHEFLPIAPHRFNFASLANESDHQAVAPQILVPETVFGQRNIALKHLWIEVVQCVLALPGGAKGMPRGTGARAPNMQAPVKCDKAILIFKKNCNFRR